MAVNSDAPKSAVGMAAQTPFRPKKMGRINAAGMKQQHLPREHQEHGLLGLANRLEVTCA